jgi:hypothetical protein
MNKRNRNQKKITKQKENAQSMLLSIEQTLGLDTLFEGKISHLSFDIPKNLRTALNEECKTNGDTACKVLTKSASLYVLASRIKKHALGNTISRILESSFTIEQVNFTQNCQTRPRRWIRKDTRVDFEKEAVQLCEIGKGICKNPAINVLIYQPKGQQPIKRKVCAYHSAQFVKISVWRYERRIENTQRSELVSV